MKLITAIARPERLDELVDTVIGNKGRGLTVSEVRGFGQQLGESTASSGGTTARPGPKVALLPKVRLEILIQDEDAGDMVDAIARCARTGAIGDGKIWVCPVDGALRVRTAEQGSDAL